MIRELKLNDWLNLAASISVLIGLGIVGYELRQNNVLAQAESIRELFDQDVERIKFELQGDFLPLMTKSVDDPSSLTDDEIERLDLYLQLNMQHYLNIAVMREQYGLAQLSVEELASFAIGDFLYGRFGRGWFAANTGWISVFSPELVKAINEEFARVPIRLKNSWPSEIRSSVNQVTNGESDLGRDQPVE